MDPFTDDTRSGRTPSCRVDVTRPVMLHDWRDVTFLHWSYPMQVIQELLPPGLTVDPVADRGWVGLVPFVLSVWTPSGTVGTRFPETNVRTYVRGPDGVPGVWFLSLDAARADAVTTARVTHSLPYMHARMTVEVTGGVARYHSIRLWPRAGARMDAAVRIGEAIPPDRVTGPEHHLTARHCLYSVVRGTLRRAWAQHVPWPLQRATVLDLDESLVEATGLPAGQGDPIAHYSSGVSVRISRLESVRPSPDGTAAREVAA